jgi:hypothetical protein
MDTATVRWRRVWWLLTDRPMWAVIVEIADLLVKHHAQMPFARDQ